MDHPALPASRMESRSQDGYRLIAWSFLRLLGLIYAAAFTSLAVQILGLAGSQGIYPLAEQLSWATERYGPWRWLAYPSWFWLAAGDWALLAVAWGGAVLGLLLTVWPWISARPSQRPPTRSIGRLLSWIRGSGPWGERVLLGLLYLGYLSLVQAGQVFTNFQWDFLLLEAGFLALFLPGARLSAGASLGIAGTPLIVWLFRWLLFRLRFESGLAKLLSGDPSWRDLTAVRHYLETQPLPHVGAWYAHQLPDGLLRLGTLGTLAVELILPLFILMPRPWRLAAAWITILWQILIMATSNHNFFNLLTIALCLFLLADRDLGWLRGAVQSFVPHPRYPGHRLPALTLAAALILVPLSLINAAELILRRPLEPLSSWTAWIDRFHIANRYHVFAQVTQMRIELEIEVSTDGQSWEELDFRYRPDRPEQAPRLIIPHQPRLDWLIWFVPQHPGFLEPFDRLLGRLQEGSDAVIRLLAHPPLEGQPVRFVRVRAWRYRFTTPQERTSSGDWWRRESLSP